MCSTSGRSRRRTRQSCHAERTSAATSKPRVDEAERDVPNTFLLEPGNPRTGRTDADRLSTVLHDRPELGQQQEPEAQIDRREVSDFHVVTLACSKARRSPPPGRTRRGGLLPLRARPR